VKYGAKKCSSAYVNAPSRVEIAIPVFGRFNAARVLMCECGHIYVLRRIFGPKRDEVTGIGENYIMRS
jgi:hypothetical protein